MLLADFFFLVIVNFANFVVTSLLGIPIDIFRQTIGL
jgi:hypothetical protein